jgi:hypothetical protein
MEGLTRLVAESLARHGFDRPVDYRRLNWSRWFRCESPHSLLFVPSKPGVFAIAEEVAALCGVSEARSRNPERSEGSPAFSSETSPEKRMLAVLQFGEAEDIAFVLDRTLTRQNPLRDRMAAGRCFVRFVVIEDATQRHSICSALNQWIASSTEKATGIGAHFASSLEFPTEDRMSQDRVAQTRPEREPKGPSPANTGNTARLPHVPLPNATLQTAPQPDTGAAANLHSPTPFPSGF